MASGVYGRRVVDSHINDRAIFTQDQYPVTGANRVLTNELESVWDKVNDAKAVLQKLEHRIETTEDAKKAEDLALSINESNSQKKIASSSQRQLGSAMKPNTSAQSASRSVGHKVAFHEPVVSYNEEFDPLHGSTAGATDNFATSVSTIQGGNKSFVARDFRTNNFDASRVTVRPKQTTQGQHSTPMQVNGDGNNALHNGYSDDRRLVEAKESPLKGTVVPTRVLNEATGPNLRDKKSDGIRRGRDVKSAGVATTVSQFDADQVYKYLRKEGIRKASQNPSSKCGFPSGAIGAKSPLFQASPYAPYKKFDVVKQRKKMKQNSEALERLKEKIQRQKQRSPSVDTSPTQRLSHREEDPLIAMETNFNGENEKPRMRKIAHGPAAPKYLGFSTAETRIRTPDGKVWRQNEPVQPYIPTRADKKPKAVSSLFKADELKSKPPLTSGRLKPDSTTLKQNKSKNQKTVRKTGKIKPETANHKKSIITPSSWREGQRIAESILGPRPIQPKKVPGHENQRPDSPPTRDTESTQTKKTQPRPATKPTDIGNANSFATAALKPPSEHPVSGKSEKSVVDGVDDEDSLTIDGGKKKMSSSIKASIPTDKLSVEARGVLDDLHLSSSESESDQEDAEHLTGGPPHEKHSKRRGRSGRPSKHHLPKDPKESKMEKIQKVRHYDQSAIQQYMAKQKAERKRKQSQERKAHREAQERKQKQLDELYKKQKDTFGKRKPGEWEGTLFTGKNRPLKQVDIASMQAIRKMDGILDGTDSKPIDADESDKENMQSKRQPLAKFDERMTAFMEKLNQYEANTSPPSTYTPQRKEPEKPRTITSAPPLANEATSEFLQKLDRYLKDETPVTAVSKISGPTPSEIRTHTLDSADGYEPNLTVEDLGSVNETSPYRPGTSPQYRDRYGDPSGTFSPRYRQMFPQDPPPPNEDFVAKQRCRAERIAALKVKAETLQERIQTESRKLVEQPIVPVKPRLEEIDAILAKSGHGQSLPIHAWTPETRKDDFRATGSRWQTSTDRGYSGVDVPEMGYSRAGLTDLSPSQLPGVAGLRKHVTDVKKNKTETDAALKIQSAYRGHSVRQAMDEWELPSGRSMTEVRRQAATISNVTDQHDEEDDPSLSEGPLSSRSDSQMLGTPIKLRSVEEILAEMKKKEYCVTDPPPIEDLLLNKWEEPADNAQGRTNPREDKLHSGGQTHDFLSDLRCQDKSGRSSAHDDFLHPDPDTDKPPWERTGGDKYSVVNVFTNKYLKALKDKQKQDESSHPAAPRTDAKSRSVSEADLSPKRKDRSREVPPKSSYSEHFTSSLSKKSPRTKSLEKHSPRFDDTTRDVPESLSSVSEHLSKSQSSIASSHLNQKTSKDATVPKTVANFPTPSELLIGQTSYSSDDDGKVSEASSTSPKMEHLASGHQSGTDHVIHQSEKHDFDSLALDKSDSILAPLPERIPPKFRSIPVSSEKKFSPAALEQKMSAELNYQEAIEESLRHLSGVERTQGVSLAQQETVSLAQLMKARQLQHDVELERLTVQAKEEVLDLEKKKAAARAEDDEKRAKENLKMQEASRKALETQAEAARSTAEAAKQLARTLQQRDLGRSYRDTYSGMSSEPSSRPGSYSTSESVQTREPGSESSSDADKKGKKTKSPTLPDRKKHYSPPSLMSEHSTTSIRLSDNDTQSSIPEQMPSTEEEDDKKTFKKLPLNKAATPDTSASESIAEELPKRRVLDESDKSISEDLPPPSDASGLQQKHEKGTASQKKKHPLTSKESKDHASDSSETSSVRFDESLTEDEIAEISRQAVVPSESHRRHQRRRSPHTGGHLDRSDMSSDDQPSLSRQKTPRAGVHRGLDDFTIGPSLAGAADSEFVHFMDDMVRQYMVEEEVRSRHQAAMLKLRERAIKEKTETELACLERMKKQVRNKGEDEKMPPIKKKQRAILRRFKMETEEIKKLKAVTKAASQERKMFLHQHKERKKFRSPDEKLDLDSELTKPRSKEDIKEPHLTSSTPIPNANLSSLPDLDISESNSELDISSASSIRLKQLKTRTFDEHRLTKREQRLMQRKKQAEQLLAWKKRLDQEEKKVCDIEKQALTAWEKEGGAKSEKTRHPATPETSTKDRKDTDPKLSPKTDSSREESSSGKSPESEHHSSPPPPSHSESSITEEIIPINSGSNSSRSVISPEQNDGAQRNQEESSDGTNADDYSQSFDSVTGSQRTPRSPKSRDKEEKAKNLKEVKSPTESNMPVKKENKSKPGDADSPSATPLLPSKRDEPSSLPTTSKIGTTGKEVTSRRRESAESWSDESFSQTQSETEQSDIECRVRALKEELKRRRMIAERLKKEQKKRHKDRLKAQEASLRSQIEAYDVFIRKTQNELTHELDNQLNASATVGPVAKPQIRSPRKSDQARQSARGLRSATASVVSPEASPRSGSHRTPAILTKHRTESESSGKSSRSLSFDDEERADDITPNGSTKSFPGVVAPLPSKHQEKLALSHAAPPSQIHDSLSSGASTPTEKRLEKPKRLDLTAAATTLSKLTTKPLSPNGFTTASASAAEKPKSHIPVATKSSPPTSKTSPPTSLKTPPSVTSQVSPKTPTPTQPSRKSLIPLPVTILSHESTPKPKEKPVTSPPSPLPSEKSLAYSEDFDSSASKKTPEEGSITTDEDISEHFSDVSGTSGEKSDQSGPLFDLSTPQEKRKESPEPNKDDSLHGVEDLAQSKEKFDIEEEDDDEKTPVISPAQTPIPSSPRTPTPDQRELGVPPFEVGDRVLLAGRETGIVRFVGETKFASGVWVGAELQKATGKNDGSVNGVRYFTCSPKHGIFAPIARVSLLSPKSQSSASAKSSTSLHFEFGEDVVQPAEDEIPTESELSKAISEAAKNFEAFAKDAGRDVVTPMEAEVTSPKKTSPAKSGLDRNRLANELSDRLLTSLLEDSMTHILDNHADKRQRLSRDQEDDQDAKRRKKEDHEEEEKTPRSSDEEDIALSASTRKLLEMLASSPEQTQELVEAVADDENKIKAEAHESLADTFTGDLLQDTLTKVLEIRRQRARKWKMMEQENEEFGDTGDVGEDFKLDDGREVEDILEAKRRKQGSDDEEGSEEKESTTPVRPVSPIFGTSQDDGLDEWFEDDIGISSFHKKKPVISKDDMEGLNDEDDVWQDGRLIEVLSSRIEPPPPPPKFVVPHRPEHILRLVEDAVDYYYSKYLRGELTSDTRIPDFLFNDKSDELSEKESDESDQEKKEADTNANHIFKTSLFDMVRELITEIFSTKNQAEEMSKRPIWLKKRAIARPSYCRRIPKTGEELLTVVAQQVSKLLNLSGDAHKLDPRITMKWGSRKKKDKVDLILIQELREEEPEWTNYDEDETTVKMQLTDTVLDMLLSDTVKCLDGIERKREERESIAVPTGEEFEDTEERSQ